MNIVGLNKPINQVTNKPDTIQIIDFSNEYQINQKINFNQWLLVYWFKP